MARRLAHSRFLRWASAASLLVTGVVEAGSVDAQEPPLTARIVDAERPQISSDGRWLVFGGTLDGRRSVFRTDRLENVTIELSVVPPGVRSGDTLQPVLSADGCVVAAITEIAFDLFRDDDRDARFDLYRLVVPECGGQPNGWELVSASDRTGVARDDVFTDHPPAVSGSGALIAYSHQAVDAPSGVSTISVVDITMPVGEPGRVQQVAGMPVEAPGGAFQYLGARAPVLSQNGRHLAFVSDTTASDALPGWGRGPVPGGMATSQVFVWDRGAADQRRAVRLISGRDGVPSAAGADEPAMSEDGRVVVFTSTDRTLVPARLSNCTPDCPAQVYRFDRDTDRNGIFDEPARRPQLAIVSAVDAGRVETGLPIAGDGPSRSPAVNADGSEIAFVTDAANLLPSRRAGGGGPLDGDLLVAEFHLGLIRRVLDSADNTAVPGAHSHPSLSKTGQVIVFETMAASAIRGAPIATTGGGRTIATVGATPRLSLADLDFGTVMLGFESTELYVNVLNGGPAAFEPALVITDSPNFKITGGTCNRGVIVAAGNSCSVKLTFNPTEPRAFRAELTVGGAGAFAPSVTAELRGAAGEPTLLPNPGGVDLDDGVVGTQAGRIAIDFSNIGFIPANVTRLTLSGANPGDFKILLESCTGRALNPDASCTVAVEFQPTDAGYRSALLIATADTATSQGAYTAAVLGGFGRYEPVFRTAEPTAQPGEEFAVGGSGFPANATLSIGFEDGGSPFATVQAGPDGRFLAVLTMPARVRIGPRLLVASGPGGAVASWTVDVLGRIDRTVPGTPGSGTG